MFLLIIVRSVLSLKDMREFVCCGRCKRAKTKLGGSYLYSSSGRFTFALKADERCRFWSGLPVVLMKVGETTYLLIHIAHS
jgi:hypothetical protein